MSYNFNEDYKNGSKGEKIFFKTYEKYLISLNFKKDCRHGDLILKRNNEKIELKTDYWYMNDTDNFFIEKYSNKEFKTPGGPFKAYKDKSIHYIYYFIKNDVWFHLDVEYLINFDYSKYELKTLKDYSRRGNSTWYTCGYKIPRKILESKPNKLGDEIYPFCKNKWINIEKFKG